MKPVRVAPSTDVRPLELFIVPPALNGQSGVHRGAQAQCLLDADNDCQAILAWLQSKQGDTARAPSGLVMVEHPPGRYKDRSLEDKPQVLSNTQRAYRKEVERFWLWAVLCRDKALSSVSGEDCLAYQAFLADPQPRERWCGVRARARTSPLWRPFEGPLSDAAQRHAVTVLKVFYGFLCAHHYVVGNPWSGVPVMKPAAPVLDAGRSLTLEQWRLVDEQLQQLSQSPAHARLSLAMKLLYATGLRASEICAARLDDLLCIERPGRASGEPPVEGWRLRVAGNGHRPREVPVPAKLMAELSGYLRLRGLHPDPLHSDNQGVYLLGQAWKMGRGAPVLDLHARGVPDRRRGVAPATLYDQFRVFFAACAQVLNEQGDLKGAQQLAHASTHWLRHSHASHAIAAGVPVSVVKYRLGHASLTTTTRYKA